ncbi:MAG: GAF domain-containing protein [Clostridia bacterium]
MELEPVDLLQADRETVLLYVDGLIVGESNWVATLANLSAVLHEALGRVNWTGFYVVAGSGRELIVGPFQGKVACTRIPLGTGVVGTCARDRHTLIVPDVHAFPGHIACDSASRSEIVVPVLSENGEVLAVIDVDSPEIDRFHVDDALMLEAVAERIANAWPAEFQQS